MDQRTVRGAVHRTVFTDKRLSSLRSFKRNASSIRTLVEYVPTKVAERTLRDEMFPRLTQRDFQGSAAQRRCHTHFMRVVFAIKVGHCNG